MSGLSNRMVDVLQEGMGPFLHKVSEKYEIDEDELKKIWNEYSGETKEDPKVVKSIFPIKKKTCIHVKKNGDKCGKPVSEKSKYCEKHSEEETEEKTEKKSEEEEPEKKEKKKPEKKKKSEEEEPEKKEPEEKKKPEKTEKKTEKEPEKKKLINNPVKKPGAKTEPKAIKNSFSNLVIVGTDYIYDSESKLVTGKQLPDGSKTKLSSGDKKYLEEKGLKF